MAAGDLLSYVIPVNDDGTVIKTFLTGKGIVVADDITITHIGHNRVLVFVVKAA
jgi:hypothetical protein